MRCPEMSRRTRGYLLLPGLRITAIATALLLTATFLAIRQSPAPSEAEARSAEPAHGSSPSADTTDRTATAAAVVGHYSLGAGANRTALSLSASGTFTMSSTAVLGRDRKVFGQWRVDGRQVVLWYNNNGRLHRWVLEAITNGDSFDLVPEELVEIYKENPRNIGVRYRRVALLAAAEPKPAGSADASRTSTSIDTARSVATPAPKPTRVTRIEKIVAAPAQERSRASQMTGLTSFVYKPAAHTPLDMALLHGPGLARLKVNERGDVTDVTVLQSTGHKVSDAEAVDTFRRWKAKPGLAGDVELPLVWAISGKRIPRRIGHITSG